MVNGNDVIEADPKRHDINGGAASNRKDLEEDKVKPMQAFHFIISYNN